MCTFGLLSSDSTEPMPLKLLSPFLIPIFLLCSIKVFSLCKKNLTLSKERITFPGIDRSNFNASDLKELHCVGNELVFKFGNETKKYLKGKINITFEGETIKTLALNRISKTDREQFIAWLDSTRSDLMSDQLREKLASSSDEEYVFDPKGHLVLAYDSHKKARAFVEVCKQYERLFWTVWLLGCTPMLLLELPMLIIIPEMAVRRFILGRTGYLSPPQNWNDWGAFWRPVFETGGNTVGKSMEVYYGWISHSSSSALILWLLAAVCGAAAIFSLFKPNKLFMSSKLMEKFLPLGPVRLTYGKINWAQITNISLKKTSIKKKGAEIVDRTIVFAGKHCKPFELSLSSLFNDERRAAVLSAIETWGSHCQVDPEIFQSLSAVQKSSYTELWLQSLNSPPKRERLRPLAAGDTLQSGRYKIVELLASGGQGVAYIAQRIGNNASETETFVIKEFMLPVYVDRKARSQAIERFENESNVLSSLNSDSIVKLEEHFIEDHRAYLVLEYIKGTSMKDRVKQGPPVSHSEALDLCRQMCEILTYLHEQTPALVHRDFTPDNLILDESGKLKLIDFNVVHQSSTNKTSATIVGKHAYMPPEQFAGRPSTQSDLYALGATIYYLLSGEDPDAFSQLFLPSKRTDLAPRWSEIISRCTALALADRASSAREVSLMLEFADPQNNYEQDAFDETGIVYQSTDGISIQLNSEADHVGSSLKQAVLSRNTELPEKELEASWLS